MKLEGMDAVAKAVPVQTVSYDQAPVKPDPPVTVKVKPAPVGDQQAGAAKAIKKNRAPADAQSLNIKNQQEDDVTEKVVREAIERANRVLSGSDRKFEISTHEKTKEIMIKVLDTNTNEVIREIPPQKIVDLVVRLCEMAGILFDEKG